MLKALAVRQLLANPGQVFSDGTYQSDVRTHDFRWLLKRLGLLTSLAADTRADPLLEQAWDAAFDWSEADRYRFTDEPTARELLKAIVDPTHGVLSWINQHF